MKKTFIQLLALSSILLLMFSSCKKDENKVTSSIGNAGTLTASTTSPALSLATKAATALTFNLSAATPVNGYQTAVTYTLQLGKKGSNFIAAQEVTAAVGNTTMTVGSLNAILHALKLTDGVAAEVEVRVKSTIAANIEPAFSNVITLTVTPYSEASYVYVPGGYQGWSPSTAPKLTSATSDGIYTGTITVAETATDLGFKITPAPNWDSSYGDAGGGKLSTSGGNLSWPSTGTFTVMVNMNNLTYTITKQ